MRDFYPTRRRIKDQGAGRHSQKADIERRRGEPATETSGLPVM
jgi:hypothetical protein